MLAETERRLSGRPFVVIGVHSPKFPNERDPEMVREAVSRYGITHPVVVDTGFEIWSQYGINAWPTLVLIDHRGYVVGAGAGEPESDTLVAAVEKVLSSASESELDAAPLPIRTADKPPGALSYPGKVVADGRRLFVADTGHHQIVVSDGSSLIRVGSGSPGHRDGPFDQAMFTHPNGIAVAGNSLYVADTGSHTVRRIDLSAGKVSTVVGTGEMGRGRLAPAGAAAQLSLRSPWDLAWDGELLYIAMAGSHQIWSYDPEAEIAGVFAGTGSELRLDGPAHSSAFAQPSGLTIIGDVLFVADSEISSIRAVTLEEFPHVSTVCGSGDLFGFGDRDGRGSQALLQHPIGIATDGRVLFVADTYNHKIKRVDPEGGNVETLFGNGEPERIAELGPRPLRSASPAVPSFFEPEGLAVVGNEVLVADTNNHRIVAVSLIDGARRTVLGSSPG